MSAISHDQFRRISERANDPRRRTSMASTQADARPLDFAQLADDLRTHGAPAAQGLIGMVGRLTGLLGGFEGTVAMGPDGPVRFGGTVPSHDLPAPPSASDLAEAERRIGMPLPEELRILYAIGDGGFGPGGGLLPLSEVVSRYLDMTGEPFGPLGQDWPPRLLVLFDQDPALLCIDLENGAIVAWDPQEIEDEESEGDWQRSFISEHPSLGAMMDEWLDATAWQEMSEDVVAREVARQRSSRKSPVTGWPILVDLADHAKAEIEFLRQSPDLRSEFGLPETGWEDEVRRRHGLE